MSPSTQNCPYLGGPPHTFSPMLRWGNFKVPTQNSPYVTWDELILCPHIKFPLGKFNVSLHKKSPVLHRRKRYFMYGDINFPLSNVGEILCGDIKFPLCITCFM